MKLEGCEEETKLASGRSCVVFSSVLVQVVLVLIQAHLLKSASRRQHEGFDMHVLMSGVNLTLTKS